MKALVQRVSRAEVRVEGRSVGRIGKGMLVLLGVERDDTETEVAWLAEKVTGIRIFPAECPAGGHKNMDRSLCEAGGAMLVVSQFTLAGDVTSGKRPSFEKAAPPEEAERLYKKFVAACHAAGARVETGVFGAMMEVELVNNGLVTLMVER
jgi:D-tyrosyl-tRNA(Tyr) deacylase